MTTQFACEGIELELFRYPTQQASNLQAWDAADEHLIKHLIDAQQTVVPTAILNDNFGALTCALAAQDPQWPITLETDAKTSLLGCQHNLQHNHLVPKSLSIINSRQILNNHTQLVLMKLPKNLHYFAQQLARLSTRLAPGTQILIGAKAKSINVALLSLIEKNLGPANASLTWKKTRVITCVSDGKARKIAPAVNWKIDELGLNISNLANVFAANKLDIGARIMLDNMPKGDFTQIVDLGCGNGVLGLHAKQCYPQAQVHFVDDSDMAIASAQHNWQNNALDNTEQDTPQGHFYWDDCLTHLPSEVTPDLVLCNPPFHQGEAITDHIAWQMFVDAYKRLKKGGILHVVGNRHLAYHVKIKRIFNNCTTVASNGKFVILQAKR
ncbi:methyltransferase [Shewanella algicola]|uniref:methyltransferase n=1 Tax=Shewanella algicola TaxID=640633 RepID=UPI002493E776|nr:methyltransferase [Shewanella algicola]